MITAGGVTGDVREIGLFVMAIDTPDNIRVFGGNNRIFSASIRNYTNWQVCFDTNPTILDVCAEAGYAVPETSTRCGNAVDACARGMRGSGFR